MTEPYFLDRHLSLFGNIYDQEVKILKEMLKLIKLDLILGWFKLNDFLKN